MRNLMRIVLLFFVLLAPTVAFSGVEAVLPAHDGGWEQAASAAADQGCPSGDCGTACPTANCVGGPCSMQLPGLPGDVIAMAMTGPTCCTGISQLDDGQRLLPATPPPRL